MGALCHQPFGLVRQPSGCFVRLLVPGTARAFVAFLLGIAFGDTRDKPISASLGWRTSAAPTHYLGTLLVLPLALLPGFAHWGQHLDALLTRPEALWLHGPAGAGISTLAAELAQRRGEPWFEAPDLEAAARWLAAHPRGLVAAREAAPGHLPCLMLRLPGLEEHPEALPALLAALAEEEGIPAPLPSALGTLPCPGNLRELRNRLLRWKLLRQLPGAEPPGPPRFEAEDLATNLHALERFLLHQALRRSYGNRVEAARRLGVSRRQLYLLIRRHGDPVRGEAASGDLPQRVLKRRPAQNSSPDAETR